MKLLALTKYSDDAASTRQRFTQFLPYLRDNGVDVSLSPLLSSGHMNRLSDGKGTPAVELLSAYMTRLRNLLSGGKYDALWVQYELFPFVPGLAELMSNWHRRPIVYDFDDAQHLRYSMLGSAAARFFLRNKIDGLVARASACIVGNAYLYEHMKAQCDSCFVIPTVVDTSRYVLRPEEVGRPPVVGWIGSPGTWKYLEQILPHILPVVKEFGGVVRVVGGGRQSKDFLGIESLDWSEGREIVDIQSMSIGLMPLTDDPWSRGKCGYKLIQYMACGRPVVASPVGVNRTIVDGSGFLADSPDEWVTALRALLGSPRVRQVMGQAGRQIVEDSFSLVSQQSRLLEVLRSVQ